MGWLEAMIVACLALVASLPFAAGLYLAKSAAGINLLPGPSPFHDLLYAIVR
jgi:hypothetical protein